MRRALRALRYLIMAFVGFTMPFEYTSVSLGPVFLTPNKMVTALLLLLVGLQLTVERRKLAWSSKHIWVVLLGIACTVSAVQAAFSYKLELRVLGTWYAVLMFYFLVLYTVVSRRDLDVLLVAFAIGGLGAVLSGQLGWGVAILGARGERIAGEGGNPNLLAFNLLIGIAALAGVGFSARSARWRGATYGAIGALILGLLLTLSRSGFVGLAAMAMLWVVRFRRIDSLKYAAPLALGIVLSFVVVPDYVIDRIETLSPSQFGQTDDSAQGRIDMIPNALEAFASNPVTGTGLACYIPWAIAHGVTNPHGIHSAYLRTLAEMGLVGFVPFSAILVVSWLDFSRARALARRGRRRGDRELRGLELRAGTLQIGFAGLLVMSLAQPSDQHKALWLMVGVSLVMVVIVKQRLEELASAAPAASGVSAVEAASPAPVSPWSPARS